MDDTTRRTMKKMKRIKAARDAMMTSNTEEKYLLMVHTGAGKS